MKLTFKTLLLSVLWLASLPYSDAAIAGIQVFSNNASTTISGPLTTGSTSMTVGSASVFPTLTNGNWFIGTLEHVVSNVVTANEIVKVTAVAGNVMTIVRAQEGTAPLTWVSGDTFALLPTAGGLSQFLQPGDLYLTTPLEIAAGVVPVNLQYSTNPYDIRRYSGWNGTGILDDSPAWSQLALVVAQGGNGFIPPGPTLVTSQVTFTVPSEANSVIYGYGVQLFSSGAIDGLRFSGGGNSDGLTVLGITYNQTDVNATAGFDIYQGSSIKLEDDAVIVSSSVAANTNFAAFEVQANSSGSQGLWNQFVNCDVRQVTGNPSAYAPFGVKLVGQANATTIRDSKISSVNYGIGLGTLGGSPNMANAVLIDGDKFEGGVQAILLNGNGISGSVVDQLRVVNNRAESLTGGFMLIQGMQNAYSLGSNVPPWLSGNGFTSSVAAYVTQANVASQIVAVNSQDLMVTPAFMQALFAQNGPMVFQTIASTGVLDAIVATVQTTGGGIDLKNSAGTDLASLRYKAGGGAYLAGSTGISIGTLGTPITQKLKGTVAMNGTTVAVSFGVTLASATYQVGSLIPNLEGGPFWVTGKTTTGFTINSGGSFTGSVDWIIEQ